MKKQMLAFYILVAVVGLGVKSVAEEATSSKDVISTITKQEKKSSRKKKAEMCSECGKPESECECHNDKKDHKEASQKESSDAGH